MIKLMSLSKTDGSNYRIEAFADTKDEVTDDVEIVGMPKGSVIDIGSSIITADGEIALRKSNDTWNWLSGGGGGGGSTSDAFKLECIVEELSISSTSFTTFFTIEELEG